MDINVLFQELEKKIRFLDRILYKNSNQHRSTKYISKLQSLSRIRKKYTRERFGAESQGELNCSNKLKKQPIRFDRDEEKSDISILTYYISCLEEEAQSCYVTLYRYLLKPGFFMPFAIITMGLCAHICSICKKMHLNLNHMKISDSALVETSDNDEDYGQVIGRCDITENSLERDLLIFDQMTEQKPDADYLTPNILPDFGNIEDIPELPEYPRNEPSYQQETDKQVKRLPNATKKSKNVPENNEIDDIFSFL